MAPPIPHDHGRPLATAPKLEFAPGLGLPAGGVVALGAGCPAAGLVLATGCPVAGLALGTVCPAGGPVGLGPGRAAREPAGLGLSRLGLTALGRGTGIGTRPVRPGDGSCT
jgi:hypothetical protein